MKPANDREEVLFREALQRASGPEREAFLDGACIGDQALRGRLAALLQAQESPDPFLEAQAPPPGNGTPTVLLPPTEGPGTLIGRYKLLEQVGEGGFGVVYVAEQREPVKRRVALKIIKLGMDTRQVVARFEAERQALALMDHPNIAKVLDAGATETGRPYFVMELVKGIPITKYCEQEKTETTERLNLFIQICHAIQHAHQKGIIHRDIKPSNILVTLQDGVAVPKVIDFGIAKATQAELTEKTVYTQFQQFIGTPAYMSPEQAEMSGLDIDTRSDIYSLGVLLYELLTGSTPFDTKELLQSGLDEMRKIIREREPMRPSTRLSQTRAAQPSTSGDSSRRTPHAAIDADLDWIVMKCLEKDRTRRYETANGVALDIERHLKHEPVLARPPSVGYRLEKSFRRNRLVFTAAGLVGLALVLGAVVSTWQAVRATKAGRNETAARLRADELARVAEDQRKRAQQGEQRAKANELTARENLYVANMNLVQQAWEQNNVGRVRQLLEATATYPNRGFEWYYWQRQAHLELQTLRGHRGIVVRVAFSPDSRRVATASFDRTAKVWDAATGEELLTLRGHSAPVWWVAFSRDGGRIVTGSFDQTAKVWDSASGQELLTLKGHLDAIASAAFSPDGRRIATGSLDRTAKVWDAGSGRELVILKGHSDGIWSVDFSPDAQWIVTGGNDHTARLWDAARGTTVRVLSGHTEGLNMAAFSTDSRKILTSAGDWTARIWDTASGAELLRIKAPRQPVNFAAFSPDGTRVVIDSGDDTAKVCDATTGEGLFTVKGHGEFITSVAFSPDGRRIVTGSADRTAKLWDATRERGFAILSGHTNAVSAVAFSPDGQRVVTSSQDKTVRIWDAASGKELQTLNCSADPVSSVVAFSPDGQQLVTGGELDPVARVWEFPSGRELLSLKGHTSGIGSVAFSPDGRRIATGSYDRTARVWDAASGKTLVSLEGHGGSINSLAFSPDNGRIVTGSSDQTAKVWHAASGRKLLTLTGHSGGRRAGVTSVAFSPDGKRVVTGSLDKTAKVWDATNGTNLFTLKGHSDFVYSVAFSPDGRRIVTGSLDQTAKVWDAVSGKELLTLGGHSNAVRSIACSADGRRIVTGSLDKTARLWEAASVAQVTRWSEEERLAAERSAAQEREQAAAAERDRTMLAQDPGAIKEWLVLLPIAYEGRDGSRAVREEKVAQEGELRPRAGDRTKVGTNELVWRAVRQGDFRLDFNHLAGAVTEWSVAYAVAYIQSENAQTNAVLKVCNDNQARVYLNGNLIHECLRGLSMSADGDVVAGVEFKAGLNVLVFKVVNQLAGWEGSVRFTDAEGKPLRGIRVTLDPEGKD